MSAEKKLCIVKDNHELLKIIPFNDKNGVGFKIVLRASIEIRFFNINYNNIVHIGPLDVPDADLNFTFHTASSGSKTKLHFKTDSTPSYRYYDVPFNVLAEPSENQILPLPLCKIVCNDLLHFLNTIINQKTRSTS